MGPEVDVRTLLVALALAMAPRAEAGPGNAVFTLVGSLAGGVGGALTGAPIYGAIDPYGSDDGMEWVLIGAPAGWGLGAAIGGTLAHGITFGGKTLRVGLVSGLVAVAGGTLVVLTPALYEDYADDKFVFAYAVGAATSVIGVPLAATLTSMFSFRDKDKKRKGDPEPVPAPVPVPDPTPAPELFFSVGPRGVVLSGTW